MKKNSNSGKEQHLALIEKVDKKLQLSEGNVFPLSPTHRKELRQLKERNIGSLKTQVSVIKSQKRDEFVEKYSKDILKEISKEQKSVDILNNNSQLFAEKITTLALEFEEFEKQHLTENIDVDKNYEFNDMLRCMKKCTTHKNDYGAPIYSVDSRASKKIAEKEFEDKFKIPFEQTNEKISKLEEQYEEAINFGDLQVVKAIYYEFKNAEQFLEKIKNLKI